MNHPVINRPARNSSLLRRFIRQLLPAGSLLITLLTLMLPAIPLTANPDSSGRERPFTIVIPKGSITYDPHHAYTTTEAQLFTGLYEGLVSYHPITLEPIPAAAETWSLAEDDEGRKTVYTFTIRENARFHNGDPLKAADFRRSWLRILNPAEKAEYASLLDIIKNAAPYRRGSLTDPEKLGIEVLSPRTLQITLEHPAPHFLRILCHHAFSPLHPDYLSGKREFSEEPFIGNGPFTLEKASPEALHLNRSPRYWDRDRVALPEILFRRMDDAGKATRLFNTDQADWLTGAIDFQALNRRNTLAVNDLFATSYYFFQTDSAAGSSARVRQALTTLAPWNSFRQNQLLPADTLVPKIPHYPEIDGFSPLTPEEAAAVLSEEGIPAASQDNPLIIAVPEGSSDVALAEQIKKAWEEKGIRTALREYPFPEYYQALKEGEYTLGTVSWIGDFADPLTFLQMWTSGSNLNDSRLDSREYDRLIQESMGEKVPERYKLMSRAEQLLLEQAVVLPLGHTPAINLIDLQFVGGWHTNFLDIHPLKYLEFLNTLPIPGVI